MGGLYNIPNVVSEILDGSLRVPKPVLRPKVTVLGWTDKDGLVLSEPYVIEDRNDVRNFYFEDGTPSPLAKALSEVFDGGAKAVEAVVTLASKAPTPDQIYDSFATSYDVLMNSVVDHITLAGVGIDTPVGTGVGGEARNFAYQMANFCYKSTVNNNAAIGFLGIAGLPHGALTGEATGEVPTLSGIAAWVSAVAAYDTSAYPGGGAFACYDGVTDANADGIPDNYRFWAASDEKMPAAGLTGAVKDALGNPVDIGAYLNVAAMHVFTVSTIGQVLNPTNGSWYYHNGASTYSGFVTTLPVRVAPTNLLLPACSPSRSLSLSQSSALTTARFVSLVTKPDGIKLSHAVTGAYNISEYYRSDYVRLSTVRTVHEVIAQTRAAADPFLGQPNSAITRLSLETEITNRLGALVDDDTLQDFDLSLISTSVMMILGQLLIDIKLDIPLELREITVRVGLTPPREQI